jgi:3-deoxy-D-manno-octulosonic-acid transferase/heptosyltransferase-1
MKILIIKLSSIGDVVHTLPALASLKRAYPDAKIDWLVEEAAAPLLDGHEMIDELIVVRNRGWTIELRKNLKVVKYLKEKRYDIAIDFQGLFKSGIWMYLIAAKKRIGFSNARELSYIFLNSKCPPYDIERHAVDRYMDLAEFAGGAGGAAMEVEDDFPLHYTKEDEEKVTLLLRESGIAEGEAFFAVAAEARWRTKLWDEACFAEVLATIKKDYGIRCVVTGAPSDVKNVEELIKRADSGAVTVAGKTSLRELAVLMKMASFALTVDSGPMHIAAAVGTPVVALFGATAPWRTGPYGKKHIVIRKELECAPCFKRECADARCMTMITPKEVADAIGGLIKKQGLVNASA